VVPETHYARSGDVRIAYQVVGDGPFDLVFVPGFISNLDLAWEGPGFKHLLSRLASFSRLILFDKRGTGLSDRVVQILEERMDDVRAVMDAVGSARAAVMGTSEGGAMAMLFAATYPERTRSLVLYGTYAHFPTWAPLPMELETFISTLDNIWGTGASIKTFAPEGSNDPQICTWWARFERSSASPSAVAALLHMNQEIDVRHILPAIRVPTLVIQRVADSRLKPDSGRYVASQIPGAKYVELPGINHAPWIGDIDSLVDEIEEFLTGIRPVRAPDRVLATVLFTDIIGATEKAAGLGDRRWHELLDNHHATVRRNLVRFRGREIDTAGDSFFAAFDGPARAVQCACAVADAVQPLGLEIRAGLHTGECQVMGAKVGGIAVHIGARVAALAGAGEVLVSSTVKDLVAGSGLRFADRGIKQLKGVPGEWHIFAVER
jgi:pimeloyl-ACP methyl ester carboxylesterase/class 3 adenylate cyclase